MRLTFGTAGFTPLQILQFILTVVCLVIAYTRPSWAAHFFNSLEARVAALSRRKLVCAVPLFFFPIVARLLLLPVYGPPAPFIHDEYAYLLQADTFASGRLTNPPPRFSKHFDSIYVLTQPTYTAEYQPAQAMTLAIGQKLTGQPWAGTLLTTGLFFVAMYWALFAWLSPTWAFVGTAIVEISIGVLSYWTNSFWGGNVPGIGGALVLGALPRLRARPRVSASIALAGGLAILCDSRPLEGVLLTLVTGSAFISWLVRREINVRSLCLQILAPIVLCFIPVGLFAAYYNARVTGQATQFPYLAYRAQYGLPQGFFWQSSVKSAHPLPVDIQAEYDVQMKMHERRSSLKALALATGGKIRSFWEFYIGIPLTLALLCLPYVWRRRDGGLLAFALLLVVGLGNFTFFAYFPHYSAAVAVLIYVVLFDCFRCLRARGPAGLFLSRTLPIICLLGLLIPVVGRYIQPLLPAGAATLSRLWDSEFETWTSREQFVSRLNADPENQLVLVRYNPRRHKNDDAWVYNRADIEHAKIIWARELDEASNRQLLRHFAGRKIWLALPDETPQRLLPYSALNSGH